MFTKGKSGNPGGRPKLPADVRKIMAEDAAEVQRTLSKTMRLTKQGLKDKIADPNATALELALATTASKAITQGDHQRLRFLVERMGGKVPERIEFEGDLPATGVGQQISHALVFQTIQELTRNKKEQE